MINLTKYSQLNTTFELRFAAPHIFFIIRHETLPYLDIAVAMQMTVFTTSPSLFLFFPSFHREQVCQESELMKSEMQIMTVQLGSTATADENPRPNKGERNSSIFIFTCVPLRDKRIFTFSADKSLGSIHFPREYIMLQLTCECRRMITYFLHCMIFLNTILLKNSMVFSNVHNGTILHNLCTNVFAANYIN